MNMNCFEYASYKKLRFQIRTDKNSYNVSTEGLWDLSDKELRKLLGELLTQKNGSADDLVAQALGQKTVKHDEELEYKIEIVIEVIKKKQEFADAAILARENKQKHDILLGEKARREGLKIQGMSDAELEAGIEETR